MILVNWLAHVLLRWPAMRRYGTAGGPFSKVHEKFTFGDDVQVDWSALAGAAADDPRARERGRRSFVLRALDEQRSLLAFSELLKELCEAGAPIDVIGTLSRVVRDEARHVDLCGRVVDTLGGWPADAPEPTWVRSDPRTPIERRILRTVLGSLCIGETISVAMIGGVRKHATDPQVQSILTTMLADESVHSRFGWWWLAQFPLRDEDRAWANGWLPRVFAGIEKTARPSAAQLTAAAGRPYEYGPFGAMSPTERDAAFLAAIEDHILPGLDRAGLDGTKAWNARKEAAR